MSTTLGDAIDRRATWDLDQAAPLSRLVHSYIDPEQRAYAEHYVGWLLGMAQEPEVYSYGISNAKAKAVRSACAAIEREHHRRQS